VIPGFATSEGTARIAARFPVFYRPAQDLQVSNIGIGSYLGAPDDTTDHGYTESVKEAVAAGLNFIDTSLNYRNQRSERAIGAALRDLKRDELVVCTKAGFLVKDALPGALRPEDVVENMHSMTPDFLADQLERSRRNLGIETIDVFYLHNPETQLNRVAPGEFHARIERAFEFLERAVSEGKIRFYGTATWDGYRRGPGAPEGLSLRALHAAAENIAGSGHHFRFIQLPFNLAMPEAYVLLRDGVNLLTSAARLGITAVASASILQGRLARNLPEGLASQLPGIATDAQRALQFTRSTPGITVALVGMSKAQHVHENLGLATVPPLTESEYQALYRQG
jgi:aryl-alcohol dehydrogenase-like predicted oxidoreductase